MSIDLDLIIPQKKVKSSPYEELINDMKPEVQEAIMLLTVEDLPSPSVSMSVEELEKQILNLSELHYQAARMKRRGFSYDKIATKLGVGVAEVRRMIDRVLNVGSRLLPKHAEELRQEVLSQLDDFLRGLYIQAAVYGREELNDKEVTAAIKILDRKINLLGIEPPKEVKLTVSQEIMHARKKFNEVIEQYNKLNGCIDVTPIQDKIEGAEIEGEE